MKTKAALLFCFVCTLLFACVSVPPSPQPVTTPAAHQWTEQELSAIKNLWIGNLIQKTDPTNRVVSHPVAVKFGKTIFFDTRFSANGQIACASCHLPTRFFTDGRKTAQAIGTATRNTPTIVGASHSHWYFHDGRADSLWSQALGPLENEIEHGGNRAQYAHIIYNDNALRFPYERLFGPMPDLTDRKRFPAFAGPVKDEQANAAWRAMSEVDRKIITTIFVNIGKAIAAYEEQLQPSPSRFDLYAQAALNNDKAAMLAALSNDQAAGLRIFISKGMCTLCHNGPLFSDFEFHNINTVALDTRPHDIGRYDGARQVLETEFNCRGEYNDAAQKKCDELTYIVLDKHETVASFKTPGLRNVSKTAPYMHDGQYETLSQVIKHYNNPPARIIGESGLRIPIRLTTQEIVHLESFLRALDSEIAAPASLLSASND